MAGDELRKRFGKWVCCRMYCPPWDCQQMVLPEQVSVDEVAFVDKPNKFCLYCFFAPCCLPCCLGDGSIDVHSVDANGHLKISRHSVCGDIVDECDDVVGVNFMNQYLKSNGSAPASCGRMLSDLKDAKADVNAFLKERREASGVSLESPGRTEMEMRTGTRITHQNSEWSASPVFITVGAQGSDMGMDADHSQASMQDEFSHQTLLQSVMLSTMQQAQQHHQSPGVQPQMQASYPQNVMFSGSQSQQHYGYPPQNMHPGYAGYPPPQQAQGYGQQYPPPQQTQGYGGYPPPNMTPGYGVYAQQQQQQGYPQ